MENEKQTTISKLKAEYAINELKLKHGTITKPDYLIARSIIVKRTRFLTDYEAMKQSLISKRKAGTDKQGLELVEEIINESIPKLDPNRFHTKITAVVNGFKEEEK